MARPRKQGLTYFPHDTDACNDEKIHALMALYGAEGYAFYFILLEKVFRTENGRITFGNNTAIKAGLARSICIPLKKFDTILATALEIGAFNKETFDKEGVLTSNGIEKRIIAVNDLRYKERERKKEKEKERKKRKTPGKLTENSKTPINKGDKDPSLRTTTTPLDDFLTALKENPAYKGIDIDNELHKMNAWLLTPRGHGRKITHKFILTWLSKCEKDLTPPQKPYEHPRTRHNRELLERMKAERDAEQQKQLSEGKNERP